MTDSIARSQRNFHKCTQTDRQTDRLCCASSLLRVSHSRTVVHGHPRAHLRAQEANIHLSALERATQWDQRARRVCKSSYSGACQASLPIAWRTFGWKNRVCLFSNETPIWTHDTLLEKLTKNLSPDCPPHLSQIKLLTGHVPPRHLHAPSTSQRHTPRDSYIPFVR